MGGLFDNLQVGRSQPPITTRLKFEFDLLAFVQRGEACPLYGGNMDEGVVRAVVRHDKTETLYRIEPLNGSSGHSFSFQQDVCRLRIQGTQTNSENLEGSDRPQQGMRQELPKLNSSGGFVTGERENIQGQFATETFTVR
jgi:hypothetical protein